jgi:hypothetical protein
VLHTHPVHIAWTARELSFLVHGHKCPEQILLEEQEQE